jgi:hypothetical protein
MPSILVVPVFVLFLLALPVLLQRSTKIEVRYQDLQGQQQEMQLAGFEARIFQHEYDHLQVRLRLCCAGSALVLTLAGMPTGTLVLRALRLDACAGFVRVKLSTAMRWIG